MIFAVFDVLVLKCRR